MVDALPGTIAGLDLRSFHEEVAELARSDDRPTLLQRLHDLCARLGAVSVLVVARGGERRPGMPGTLFDGRDDVRDAVRGGVRDAVRNGGGEPTADPADKPDTALVVGTSPALEARLRHGTPTVSNTPRTVFPDLPLPADTGIAALVPAAPTLHPGTAPPALCTIWPPGTTLDQETLSALDLMAAVLGTVLGRHDATRQRAAVQADLENRLRNLIALVRSVSLRSAELAPSLEDFILHHEGRLDALMRIQMATARGGMASFELLLREELLAQLIQDGPRVRIEGIDLSVTAHEAETLGLVLHELAVNAVKFGALARSGGALGVRWWMEARDDHLVLRLDWRESVAEPFPAPSHIGFGLTVIQRLLPYQLDAQVETRFERHGLSVQVTVTLGAEAARGAARVLGPL